MIYFQLNNLRLRKTASNKKKTMFCDCCRHSTSLLTFYRDLLNKVPALNNSQICGVP